ncbi:MAG: hypothetical protein HPY71_04565 [Firmicutes bacterium]|nr:hypothetical protein [Bacillota bacterium]
MLAAKKGRLGWKAFVLCFLGLFVFIALGVYVASRGSGDLAGVDLSAQLNVNAGEIAGEVRGTLKKEFVAIRRITTYALRRIHIPGR